MYSQEGGYKKQLKVLKSTAFWRFSIAIRIRSKFKKNRQISPVNAGSK
jgi:hypothetical protein